MGVLRKAGVGKPLFRKGISRASANRSKVMREWNALAREAETITAAKESFEAHGYNNARIPAALDAAFSKVDAKGAKLAEQIGPLTTDYNRKWFDRKMGVKGAVRVALAGPKALAKLKRMKKLKQNLGKM